jgi:hypothetical protein
LSRPFLPRAHRGLPGEPGADVVRPGDDQGSGLVDRLGPLRPGGALGDGDDDGVGQQAGDVRSVSAMVMVCGQVVSGHD